MEPILEFGYDDSRARLGIESFADYVTAKAEALNKALSAVRPSNAGDGMGMARYAGDISKLEGAAGKANIKVSGLLASLDHMGSVFTGGLGIGIAVGGLALLEKALDKSISKAREFQVAQISIAAHMTSAFKDMSGGKVLPDKEAFDANLNYAKKIQMELLKMSTQNHLTFGEQVGAFQASISAGARKGLNIDQILALSNQAAMVAKAIGLHGQEIENASRLLIGGGVNVSRSAIGMNLGVTNADLATRRGKDLFNFLSERTKGFKAAQETFGKSIEGMISTLESKIDVAASRIGMKLMTVLSPDLKKFTDAIGGPQDLTQNAGESNAAFSKRVADAKKNADELDQVIDSLTTTFHNLFTAVETVARSAAFHDLMGILATLAKYADKIALAAVFYGIGKAALSATVGVARLVTTIRALSAAEGVEDVLAALSSHGSPGMGGGGGMLIGGTGRTVKTAADIRRDALRSARDGNGVMSRIGPWLANDYGRYGKKASEDTTAIVGKKIDRVYDAQVKNLDIAAKEKAAIAASQALDSAQVDKVRNRIAGDAIKVAYNDKEINGFGLPFAPADKTKIKDLGKQIVKAEAKIAQDLAQEATYRGRIQQHETTLAAGLPGTLTKQQYYYAKKQLGTIAGRLNNSQDVISQADLERENILSNQPRASGLSEDKVRTQRELDEAKATKEKAESQRTMTRRQFNLLSNEEKAALQKENRDKALAQYQADISRRDDLRKHQAYYEEQANGTYLGNGVLPVENRTRYAEKAKNVAAKIEALSDDIDANPAAYESLTGFQKHKYKINQMLGSAKARLGDIGADAADGLGNGLMYATGGLMAGQAIQDSSDSPIAQILGELVTGGGIGAGVGSIIPGLGTLAGGGFGALYGAGHGLLDATFGRSKNAADTAARENESDYVNFAAGHPYGDDAARNQLDINRRKAALDANTKAQGLLPGATGESGTERFVDRVTAFFARGSSQEMRNSLNPGGLMSAGSIAASKQAILDDMEKSAKDREMNAITRIGSEPEDNTKQYAEISKLLAELSEMPDFKKTKENLANMTRKSAITALGVMGKLPGQQSLQQSLSSVTGLTFNKNNIGMDEILRNQAPQRGVGDTQDARLQRLLTSNPKLAKLYASYKKNNGFSQDDITNFKAAGANDFEMFTHYVNTAGQAANLKSLSGLENHYNRLSSQYLKDTNLSDSLGRSAAMSTSERDDKFAAMQSGLGEARLKADTLFGSSASPQGRSYVSGMMNNQLSDSVDDAVKNQAEYKLKTIQQQQKMMEQQKSDAMFPLQQQQDKLTLSDDALAAKSLVLKKAELTLQAKKLNLDIDELKLRPQELSLEGAGLNLQRSQIEQAIGRQPDAFNRLYQDRQAQMREDQRSIASAQRGVESFQSAPLLYDAGIGSNSSVSEHEKQLADYRYSRAHPVDPQAVYAAQYKQLELGHQAAVEGQGSAQDALIKATEDASRHADDYVKALQDESNAVAENNQRLAENTIALAKFALEQKALPLDIAGKKIEKSQLGLDSSGLVNQTKAQKLKQAEDEFNAKYRKPEYDLQKAGRGADNTLYGIQKKNDLRNLGDDKDFLNQAVPFLKKYGITADPDTMREFYSATHNAATNGAGAAAKAAADRQSSYGAAHLAGRPGAAAGHHGDITVPVTVQTLGITEDEFKKEIPKIVIKAIDDYCRSKSRKPT